MNITRGLRRALQINPKGLGVQDMIISGARRRASPKGRKRQEVL